MDWRRAGSCGAVTGAVIVFLVTQTSFGKPLRAKAGPFYTRIAREMHQGAAGYLLFLRLAPVFPFALVNIIPALLHVRLWTFVWTTIIGITPMTFVYTNLGETLGSISSFERFVLAGTGHSPGLAWRSRAQPHRYQENPRPSRKVPAKRREYTTDFRH